MDALFCDSPCTTSRQGTHHRTVGHIRRQPQLGWIKGAFTTSNLARNLFIEDGMLWDENDQLVAQSRQLQTPTFPEGWPFLYTLFYFAADPEAAAIDIDAELADINFHQLSLVI